MKQMYKNVQYSKLFTAQEQSQKHVIIQLHHKVIQLNTYTIEYRD